MLEPSAFNKNWVRRTFFMQGTMHFLSRQAESAARLLTLSLSVICHTGGLFLQVRLAWVSAAVVIAARSTEYLPSHVAAFIHVNSWGLLIGTNLWTTFIAGITMFKNLPRQTFGRLQVCSEWQCDSPGHHAKCFGCESLRQAPTFTD
jgi:hypothetical protein